MRHDRRSFLKATGASLGAVGVVGATASTAAAAVADRWEPADSSNYTNASRTASDMRWLVMHTIEGSYEGCISWFQNPDANVSSHYVVGESADQITKMVRLEDIAWTQGNWEYNETGVSIELEGYADETNFGDTIYQQAAEVARYVCDTFDIPKQHPTYDLAPCSAYSGEGGIIGHSQVPDPNDCSQVTGGKYDPGDTWDWDYFMSLVTDGSGGGGDTGWSDGDIVHCTADLNTREQPGTDSPIVATMPTGSNAEIVNGPTDEDGYTWWGLHWLEDDIWGWSVEAYLDAGYA
ncbi:peptidoglycan recognition protein family protein [Haloarchaeobius amylolyticus]|uniref:peptidoglycan recognition protein family protein n=1 Tax=Haloarchaeobius amylolyticus TaxID=1198296 RepID=UPI00226F6CA4|nr:peptidoglycan recognition family protein [Haloarchaeobius amylolyticus]